MTRLLVVTFLAGAGVFCGYAIGRQPHVQDWTWMRRSANVEDRRDDLAALSAGLDADLITRRLTEAFAAANAKPKPKAK